MFIFLGNLGCSWPGPGACGGTRALPDNWWWGVCGGDRERHGRPGRARLPGGWKRTGSRTRGTGSQTAQWTGWEGSRATTGNASLGRGKLSAWYSNRAVAKSKHRFLICYCSSALTVLLQGSECWSAGVHGWRKPEETRLRSIQGPVSPGAL